MQVAERALRGEGGARPLDRAGILAPSAFDTTVRYGTVHRGVSVAATDFSTVSTVQVILIVARAPQIARERTSIALRVRLMP